MRERNPSSRRKSLRIPKYDYSQPNAYFITICSFQKKLLFGKIQQGQVILSEAGEIVGEVWHSLSNRYPIVELDAFIVMPNHVHGILKVMSDEVGAIHELPLQTSLITNVGAVKLTFG